MFTATIAGLGIMGGSFAMALRGFRDCRIIGCNRSQAPIELALDEGTIDEGYVINNQNAQKALGQSDLIVLCMFPKAVIEFIETYSTFFKKDAIVTDISGIKEDIVNQASAMLPSGIEFVGGHPMAGKETWGYESATATLYNGCNYVITPQNNTTQALKLIEELAMYLGAGRITYASPKEHDMMIAYTSQLAHVLASVILDNKMLMPSKGFEGNSFRDLTRVGTINSPMWAELFALNKNALSEVLRDVKNDLSSFIDMIELSDIDGMKNAMQRTSNKKEQWKCKK